jgi:hypothetical protein
MSNSGRHVTSPFLMTYAPIGHDTNPKPPPDPSPGLRRPASPASAAEDVGHRDDHGSVALERGTEGPAPLHRVADLLHQLTRTTHRADGTANSAPPLTVTVTNVKFRS